MAAQYLRDVAGRDSDPSRKIRPRQIESLQSSVNIVSESCGNFVHAVSLAIACRVSNDSSHPSSATRHERHSVLPHRRPNARPDRHRDSRPGLVVALADGADGGVMHCGAGACRMGGRLSTEETSPSTPMNAPKESDSYYSFVVASVLIITGWLSIAGSFIAHFGRWSSIDPGTQDLAMPYLIEGVALSMIMIGVGHCVMKLHNH